jgi:hypothetical protein
VQWCTSVIPALGRLRQKEWEFKVSLGSIRTPCLNKIKQKSQEADDFDKNFLQRVWWWFLVLPLQIPHLTDQLRFSGNSALHKW